jgi:hypothetical protein
VDIDTCQIVSLIFVDNLTMPHYTDNLPPSRSRVCTINDNNTSRQKRKAPITNEIADMKTKRLRNQRSHDFKDGISSCEDENLLSNTPAGSAHSKVALVAPDGMYKMVEQASKKVSHPEHKLVENTPVWTRPESGFPSEELASIVPSHNCPSKPTEYELTRPPAALQAYCHYLASHGNSSPSTHPQSHHTRDRTEDISLCRKDSAKKLHSTSMARQDYNSVSRSSVLENQEHVIGSNGKLLLNSEQPGGPRLSTPLPKSSSCIIDNRQLPLSQAGELSSSLERAPITCDITTPPKLSSECGKKGKTRARRVPSREDDINEVDPLCLRPDSNAPPLELVWNDPPIHELLLAASPKRKDQSHNSPPTSQDNSQVSALSLLAKAALGMHD